jgi:hypothetical protein
MGEAGRSISVFYVKTDWENADLVFVRYPKLSQ